MVNYSFKTAIPTASISKGLVFDKDMYFSSNTYIYKYNQEVYSVVATLPGYIINFFCRDGKFYSLAGGNLSLSCNGRNIASMKKDGDCIFATEDFIFTNDNNQLEVWHNPKEYKLTMFEMYRSNSSHTGRISALLVYKHLVFTGSYDCTVRVYDIQNNSSRRVQTVKSRPVGIHKVGEILIILCCDGQIYKIQGLQGLQDLQDQSFELLERVDKQANITSSQVCGDLLCYTIYKEGKSTVEVLKEDSVIYSVEVDNKVEEIGLRGAQLALKCQDFVGLYDLKTDSFNLELVLPTITTFDINKEYVAVGCTDKKIRLYDDNRIINTFQDEKSTHPIHKIFFVKNSVLSLAIDGHISLFDIHNGTCFRSFKVPVKISSAVVCGDGILIFLADYDTCSIRVVDLQRSKEIDHLEGHEAVIKDLKYHRGVLYSLSLDNEVRKWDYIKGDSQTLSLDKMPISIAVDYNQVAISFVDEVVTYDLDLSYLYSFDYSVKSRKRNELYMHEKGAERVEFALGGGLILLGGEFNKLYVCDVESGETVQELKLSHNKSWENYDDRFYKQRKHNFDKEKIVEALEIKHSPDQYKFYVQTREGLVVFRQRLDKFSPLDLDVETTPVGIQRYIKDGDYLKGLLGALRLGDVDLLDLAVLSVPEDQIQFVVKYTPGGLVEVLREYLLNTIQEGSRNSLVYLWLRHILFYHSKSDTINSGLEIFKKKGEGVYKTGLENLFILKSITKKK